MTIPVAPRIDPILSRRRYDMDWLRVLAMGTIFLFHCARFFDYEGWHVKNPATSHPLFVFVMFTSQWIMPLFFIISGFGTRFSLQSRGVKDFVSERFFRLVVPLVFGIFVLVPPQVYIERTSHGQFNGSFFDFFPHYFDGLYGFGGNFAWMGLHLWYLELLFVFSLLTLPLFLFMSRRTAHPLVGRVDRPLIPPARLYLACLPILIMESLVNLSPHGFGIRDFGGWSPLTYLVFFVIGFMAARKPGFWSAAVRYRHTSLFMGIVTASVGLILVETKILDTMNPAVPYCVTAVLRSFNSWFWLCAILGFGHRYLDFVNGALSYAGRAVLPFYILHQTVIVIIAYFLVGWDTPVAIKYPALCILSFITIMALYEGVVRRIGVVRFLFGMKTKPAP